MTESPVDYYALMNQVAVDVIKSLSKKKLTGLIIDESGYGKERKVV